MTLQDVPLKGFKDLRTPVWVFKTHKKGKTATVFKGTMLEMMTKSFINLHNITVLIYDPPPVAAGMPSFRKYVLRLEGRIRDNEFISKVHIDSEMRWGVIYDKAPSFDVSIRASVGSAAADIKRMQKSMYKSMLAPNTATFRDFDRLVWDLDYRGYGLFIKSVNRFG